MSDSQIPFFNMSQISYYKDYMSDSFKIVIRIAEVDVYQNPAMVRDIDAGIWHICKALNIQDQLPGAGAKTLAQHVLEGREKPE